MDVELNTYIVIDPQGTVDERHVVLITESYADEASPRNLLRRAINAFKSPRAGKAERGPFQALIVSGLLIKASQQAGALGAWSSSANYDPLPDLREVLRLARTRLLGTGKAGDPVEALRDDLERNVLMLSGATPEQRMGRW